MSWWAATGDASKVAPVMRAAAARGRGAPTPPAARIAAETAEAAAAASLLPASRSPSYPLAMPPRRASLMGRPRSSWASTALKSRGTLGGASLRGEGGLKPGEPFVEWNTLPAYDGDAPPLDRGEDPPLDRGEVAATRSSAACVAAAIRSGLNGAVGRRRCARGGSPRRLRTRAWVCGECALLYCKLPRLTAWGRA